MPSIEEFRTAIHNRLKLATSKGATQVEINAGELHRTLGGYPGPKHTMPSCCSAMHEITKSGDEITSQPPKGKGASLTIRYKIPR